ncbi:MAG: hypothetical protein JXA67_04000, partial [Micromonosporaceae bacterium]|nr:hypothetical protein [Micromonosporaceae bacterium]
MSITESYDETVALNDVSPADMDRQRRYSKMTTIGGAGDTGPAGHFWTVRLAQAWKYPRMTNARALARVHRDLAAGHPRAAARRLRTMLARDPNNIEIYRLLASIHRLLGDPAEAGRWGFLTDDVTEVEIAAFERAHPQAWIRLRLLGWSGDPAKLPSDACRARLAVLSREVAECTIPTQREAKRTNALHGQAGTLGRPVVPGTIPTQRGASQPTTGGLLIPHGPFPGAGRARTPGGFQAGTDETGRAAQRRFEPGSV